MNFKHCAALAVGLGLLGGCNQPTILPNTDPALRRTSTQFAADAAKRHPYKADAPRAGEAQANSQYNLSFSTLEVLNYGSDDMDDVEIWVNRKYVVWLPKIEKGKAQVKTISFSMLFDDSGNAFWTDSGKNPVEVVEIYRGGKMYNVPTKLAD